MARTFVAALLLSSTVVFAQAPAGGKKAAGELDVSRLPFSSDSIRQVILHHMEKIQDCYEDTMAEKERKVEGKLMTSFTITPQGTVKSAKVVKKGTTLKDKGLHDCVVTVLNSMSFPKPPDGKDYPIEYPFNLKAIE
jgi:hypothetical protein